ncbi:oxidoreductase [Nocardioides pantholopis]|uniref:oxidoreductase n=1 Tax=Nocardioides pantholopis TaxID=2483798 RepID=UPI000F08848B|nr:oxidoreductase [Nocardioides pantholopis]
MSQNLKFVQEFLDEAGPTDVSATFADWTALVDRLAAKVKDRFELHRDPSTDALESFAAENGPKGSIRGYTGPEIDWMIHSHMENAAAGFVNVHLTIWLGPQVKVPHFGMALGAFPQGWLFLDSVPRSYLMEDTESYDKYYEPLNAEWERVQAENDFIEPFVSRSAFVRASLSPTAMCFMAPGDGRLTELVTDVAERHLDRWLQWVDEAERVPEEEQAALAATDEAIRRNIAERDPANVMGERFFGPEMTQDLVRALWGGGRVLPRPLER